MKWAVWQTQDDKVKVQHCSHADAPPTVGELEEGDHPWVKVLEFEGPEDPEQAFAIYNKLLEDDEWEAIEKTALEAWDSNTPLSEEDLQRIENARARVLYYMENFNG
jgi:hypothetical protein